MRRVDRRRPGSLIFGASALLLCAFAAAVAITGVQSRIESATNSAVRGSGGSGSEPGQADVRVITETLTKAELLSSEGTFVGVFSQKLPYDRQEFEDYVSAARASPNIIALFTKWDSPFRAAGADIAYDRGAVPLVSWESWRSGSSSSDPAFSLADIGAGAYDGYIHAFAADIASYGRPVIIRFDHEMNGDWYPWGNGVNGNTPSRYVEVWQRVHAIFADEGADNTIWSWSANIVRGTTGVASRLAAFYPGDDVVDLVGLTGYGVHERSATELFQPTIDVIRGFTEKPILLTEVGAAEGPDKPAFIASLFEYLRTRRDLVGFVWFQTSTATGATGDWKFDDNPASLEAYRAGVRTIDLAEPTRRRIVSLAPGWPFGSLSTEG